ncbi:MAG: aminotransferase class III-fold pyridoxal phosphate-dependent enzyme [Microthrixaceae bacterium]|nr:aminotransferase class III-fold pyridoxal phosphate-dependent enzyme [Microthrixaceae bacterium]
MFVRGEGSRLWDAEGNEYLDLLSGLAVTSLGHSHPVVADALAAQARRLVHVSNLFGTEHNAAVATTLDRLLGGGWSGVLRQLGCRGKRGCDQARAAFRWARPARRGECLR